MGEWCPSLAFHGNSHRVGYGPNLSGLLLVPRTGDCPLGNMCWFPWEQKAGSRALSCPASSPFLQVHHANPLLTETVTSQIAMWVSTCHILPTDTSQGQCFPAVSVMDDHVCGLGLNATTCPKMTQTEPRTRGRPRCHPSI